MNATDKKVMAKLIPFLGRKWGENSFLQLEDMHENASVLLWKTCSFFLKIFVHKATSLVLSVFSNQNSIFPVKKDTN
jgi:hypothetical protein